jgi:hypothetical protein
VELRLDTGRIDWRVVEDEIVVHDLTTDEHLTLNHSAAALWEPLVAGASEEGLVERLVDEYDVSGAQARADVSAFVADLLDRRLLARTSASSDASLENA